MGGGVTIYIYICTTWDQKRYLSISMALLLTIFLSFPKLYPLHALTMLRPGWSSLSSFAHSTRAVRHKLPWSCSGFCPAGLENERRKERPKGRQSTFHGFQQENWKRLFQENAVDHGSTVMQTPNRSVASTRAYRGAHRQSLPAPAASHDTPWACRSTRAPQSISLSSNGAKPGAFGSFAFFLFRSLWTALFMLARLQVGKRWLKMLEKGVSSFLVGHFPCLC